MEGWETSRVDDGSSWSSSQRRDEETPLNCACEVLSAAAESCAGKNPHEATVCPHFH